MSSLFKNIGQLVSAGVIVLTFLAYLCPLVNPEKFPWLSFFGTAFPWLLLLNAGLFLFLAWRRERFALYHLGILAVGWSFVTGFVGFSFGKDVVPESAISIATHNVGAIYRGHRRVTPAVRDKIVNAYAGFLKENGFPDVLCTQETYPAFYRLLAEKMGYSHTFNLKKGTVILSRFPMEAGGEVAFGGKSRNSILWVDIRFGTHLLRVYNCHLQSNHVTGETEKVIEEGELREEETWDEIGGILEKVGGATRLRARQAQLLREHLATCPHEAVICGDFNDTPNSWVYRILAENRRDTFREKGLGFGSTYDGALPFLRIDYVLTGKKLKTYACKRVKGEFSDHFPVFAEIGF